MDGPTSEHDDEGDSAEAEHDDEADQADSPRRGHRIPAIDLARGLALLAMAVFHFSWDLERFGVIQRGTTTRTFGWELFSSSIAGSFLFLVGVSLFLAHHGGVNRRTFLKRTAMVGAAALLITIVTLIATPNRFIFFGVLHCITFASLFGVLFVRLPWYVVAGCGLFFVTGEHFLTSAVLDGKIWWWSGLSLHRPLANDYVPVFPWFGYALLGIAMAKVVEHFGGFEVLGRYRLAFQPVKVLRFLGRHSLIFYLVHQPVLLGVLTAYFALVR